MTGRRWSLLLSVVLVAGCATPGQPGPSTDAHPTTGAADGSDIESFGDDFWAGVRDNDIARASRHLANHLKRPPAADKLSRQLEMLLLESGRVVSWQMKARARDGDDELREYEVQCSRGVVRAALTFHRKTRNITDLTMVRQPVYFPAPIKGMDADVSWTNVTVGPDLGATIASPRRAASDKLPAVVLIGEGGRMDRDEMIGLLRPFRDLGDGLASRGAVTIRFDKRSFVMPGFFRQTFTLNEELIQDGVSAVAVVRRQPMVDPRRVFLVGHGLGGLAAIAVARRTQDIAGVVLLGVPARPMLLVALEDLRERDPGEEVMARAANDVQAITDGTAPPDRHVLGMPAAFWYDLAKRDSFDELLALKRPVLLLRGEADTFATANDQLQWSQRLAGVPVRAESVPMTDHALMAPQQRRMSRPEIEAGDGPRVSSYLIDIVSEFVTGAARSGGRAN